jgi:Cu+-exporting ATPase
MHYIPESAREFLQDEASLAGTVSSDEAGFHYRSAPIYLLTVLVGLLLGCDLVVGAVASTGAPGWADAQSLFGFRLALLAAVLGGARILFQSLEGLFAGRIGADLALTLACLAAILLREPVTAALVVFVALCGESIEGYTVDRAQQAIRRIFQLCPAIAHRLVGDVETDVPVEDLQAGDLVVVRPGERLPVDGTVDSGRSAVDQSALTGESLPIDKEPGEPVFSGTLNQFGALVVRTESIGEQTTLGQVINLVAEATQRKAPLERTADRLARLFLPFVLGAALATLVGWRFLGEARTWESGFLPALAVLVVACPCPLILATPSAVMAAMAWLARAGIVVKGSAALERLASVDTFVFDKTGTLTRGEPVLGIVAPSADSGLTADELIRTAAVAEHSSEHVLARLVVREAEKRGMVVPAPENFSSEPGFGVVASVAPHTLDSNGNRITVGNRRLLEQHGVPITEELEALLRQLATAGQSAILVAVDGTWVGGLGVTDVAREEATEVLSALKDNGIQRIVLLTGDRLEPAEAVAAKLPTLDLVQSDLLPADKAAWVSEAERDGGRVAMVGDGVNDAPALATSTVGIALGGVGSDLAAEAGDLVLMGDPLKPLPGLFQLSRQLVTVIRQSIWLFAFGMNGLGILLGATGFLSPAAAAVFHEISSLAVMLNAMRLLWFQRWDETRWGILSHRISNAAARLTETLSPSRLTYAALRYRQSGLKLIAAGLLFAWCVSGIVILPENERAVVARYGRYRETLPAGWHWRWPEPLETIHRQRIFEVRSLPIGFRTVEDSNPQDVAVAPIEWNSQHDQRTDSPLMAEAQVVTGDEVLVELTAVVEYRIGDLRRYTFGVAEPESLLKATTESAIRQVAATASLADLLADRRREIERDCLVATRDAVTAYRLGLEIIDLHLLDIHPPRQVIAAYRQVADALEEREQLINEAEAYYARRLLAAAGARAIAFLSETGQPDHVVPKPPTAPTTTQRHRLTVSNWSLDDPATWKALMKGKLLSGEAAATLDAARAKSTITTTTARGQADRFLSLLANGTGSDQTTEVSKLHLYFKAIEQALAGRPLTILDPKAAGRKHLMLTNPRSGGPPLLAPLLPGDEEEQIVSPPRKSKTDRKTPDER